ncbi:MAG TPA: peptide deformylase [Polyangia bacterium]
MATFRGINAEDSPSSPESPRILPIVQAGHPVLRQQAASVAPGDLRRREFVELIEAMRETMRSAPGVGLAAPQIGESLAIAVIEDRADYQARLTREELEARERQPVPFHVIANPRLTVIDPGPVAFTEGCLSVTGYAAVTARAAAVRVDALDHRGEPIVIEARGWYARILQHEIDHLNGTLYVDRMDTRTFTFVGTPPPALTPGRQR